MFKYTMATEKPDDKKLKHDMYVKWTEDHENILVEWADKAMCYRWLHGRSHQLYSRANTWFTIPVIIMSTLTGTANFAQDKFSGATREYVVVAIGAVNILAGIITTIQQFLKISELNEAHRVSSLSWDKFYRNIKVELAKSPKERTPAIQILKSSKEEFDRLMETSPAISTKVTKLFKSEFSCSNNRKKALEEELEERQAAYKSLKKPEICGTLESSKLSVYKGDKNMEKTIVSIEDARKHVEQKGNQSKIENIILEFQKTRLREPTNDEIIDELDNTVTVKMIELTKSKIVKNDEKV
jgi:hypothetical protein